LSNLIFSALALIHAWHVLGWRRATTFFSVVFVLAWIAESLSIATCLATCYHYTPVLGWRIGQVPLFVPLGWFAMIYNSYVIVNLAAEGQPVSTKGDGVWMAWLALLTAFVMATWDLTLDPYMVIKEQAWVWEQGGIYFGIPAANYVSWVEVVFIIAVVYRMAERGLPLPKKKISPWMAGVPVAGYALMSLPAVFIGVPDATRVLAPFTAGIPILMAVAPLMQARLPRFRESGNYLQRLVAPEHVVNDIGSRILFTMLAAAFLAHIGMNGLRLEQGGRLPFDQMTVFFSAFVVIHACFMLGWRRALWFFGATAFISFAFEYVGVKTGLIFGHYYYTDVLGWKILGAVSWPIPLAYFMVLYPSTMMANLAIFGTPVTQKLHWGWSIFAALLGALIMSAWDLTMDPYMSLQQKAWIWRDGGRYFGIPFLNFSGWVFTTFTAGMAYRIIEHRIPLKPMGHMSKLVVIAPILCYAVLPIGDLAMGYPEATKVIAPFSMGIAVIAALMRMGEPRDEADNAKQME
ncbi:MAG: carotenoid biosynthesis protein, partial [Holophagaceae bacterium]|nr:carotenoid biosynthesis protein [Holophagaceae bacterium]